jgi:hypothetical protein
MARNLGVAFGRKEQVGIHPVVDGGELVAGDGKVSRSRPADSCDTVSTESARRVVQRSTMRRRSLGRLQRGPAVKAQQQAHPPGACQGACGIEPGGGAAGVNHVGLECRDDVAQLSPGRDSESTFVGLQFPDRYAVGTESAKIILDLVENAHMPCTTPLPPVRALVLQERALDEAKRGAFHAAAGQTRAPRARRARADRWRASVDNRTAGSG